MINIDQLMLDLKELHQEFVTTTREADSLAKKSVRDVPDWNFYVGSGDASAKAAHKIQQLIEKYK